MTARESKGLEYDTIVFIDLEDSAHVGFADSPEEEPTVFVVTPATTAGVTCPPRRE